MKRMIVVLLALVMVLSACGLGTHYTVQCPTDYHGWFQQITVIGEQGTAVYTDGAILMNNLNVLTASADITINGTITYPDGHVYLVTGSGSLTLDASTGYDTGTAVLNANVTSKTLDQPVVCGGRYEVNNLQSSGSNG